MIEVNLNFHIHCQRPIWGIINSSSKFKDSRYRIYINDDLITERSWVWNNEYLNENIWMHGEDNTNYIVKLEPVVHIPDQAKFIIDGFRITNTTADIEKIDDLQVNFTLR
jgi:hypothetical protein